MPSASRARPEVCGVLVFYLSAGGLCSAQHSAERALGVMPDRVTSLALIDVPRLFAAGSAYAKFGEQLTEGLPQFTLSPPLRGLLDNCRQASPELVVVGGSDFVMRGSEPVEFRARVLVCTRNPIPDPAACTSVDREPLELASATHQGVEVYSLHSPGQQEEADPDERFHFALASDHAVVVAEDPEEVAEMALRWREERTLDTERYARALTPQLLDSPLVILRHGLPASRAEGAEGGSDGAFVAGVIDAEAARWIARYDGPDAETNLGHCGGIKRWASPSRDGDVEVREWTLPEGYDDRESDLILGPMALFGFEPFI